MEKDQQSVSATVRSQGFSTRGPLGPHIQYIIISINLKCFCSFCCIHIEHTLHFTFFHLADAFIHGDLKISVTII